MIRLSSSITLGLAIFLPVFWFVFFGSLSLFVCLTDPQDLPVSNSFYFKSGFLSIFLFFALIIYKTFFQLKRIELEDGKIYITNYFKTISIRVEAISKLKTIPVFNLAIVTLHITHKTIFGKKIRFISDEAKLQYLKNELSNSEVSKPEDK